MCSQPYNIFSTYSIVARDRETGQLGVAVQTHQMCVGAVVPWLAAGVGAVATQSLVNVKFGPVGLAMLQAGIPAPKVIDALVASDENAHVRQVAVVDTEGRASAWTGQGCIPEAGHHVGNGYSVQANMMTSATVVPAMAEAFEQASGDLAQRLLAALEAAQQEGGDIRGMQSAALRVVTDRGGDPAQSVVYDVRVDEHERPLEELSRLVRLVHAQWVEREGYEALEKGDRERALSLWTTARAEAPELEEMPFWQAITLADDGGDAEAGAQLLGPVLRTDPRREYWLDLIRRLQTCGLIKRPEAAAELLQRLE